jgi:hypothetical protein
MISGSGVDPPTEGTLKENIVDAIGGSPNEAPGHYA